MKIKHEHIRTAILAWADVCGGEKGPAAAIVDAWRQLGLNGLYFHPDSHPESLSRNTQKIFRWVKSDAAASREKLQFLMPAIERSMPVYIRARMHACSSSTCRELVARKENIDRELEAMADMIMTLQSRVNGSGSAGNSMLH